MTRMALVAALAAGGLGCAGAPPAPEPLPSLCELDRVGAAGSPDASTWIALLLRGFDAESRRVTVPALDCAGAQVRWSGPALACDDGALSRTMLPERPLSPYDVVESSAPNGATLVWIPTAHFASGDALGPVALVEPAGQRLRVVALGALRAYPRHARMRLEALGQTRVLVAEGERCASSDPATCTRAARLVPLRGQRFVPEPLQGEEGGCLSPAWFELARRDRERRDSRWQERELGASLVFDAAGLTVEEQIVVHDLGANPGAGPRPVLHRAQSTRKVRWSGGRLVGSGTPLWKQMSVGEAAVDR